VNWNTDSYGYGIDTPSLYQSHPWVLAVRADGSAFGVLADTTWRSTIDLSQGISIVADGPEFPVIIIEAPHPEMVVRRLTQLTGRIDLPPLWALGYHQCRYSYYPDSRGAGDRG
jgi:alpha-glucosidase